MRVLIYSHDSFGLGHLRRCRRIAHALVGADKNLTALIISGSPIIGSFDFRARVDFVRVPGVVKLRNGNYTPLNLLIDIEETLDLRASIIQHTALAFAPDLFLVDKEPLGLGGEVEPALRRLKQRGTRLVLGLREVMDSPDRLQAEWARKHVMPALRELYDEIWVYGPEGFHDPLEGLAMPAAVRDKLVFTGFQRTTAPAERAGPTEPPTREPYVLVTAGGGGDGADLIDWVLSAYESDPAIPLAPVFLFGPFMDADRRESFSDRVRALGRGAALEFEAAPEYLMTGAQAIVCMGGYNTFCEMLSFDKPALMVPRTEPREEQLVRARRAAALGLVDMRVYEEDASPATMVQALRGLAWRRPPSEVLPAGWMDGLDVIARRVSGERAVAPDAPTTLAAQVGGG
ncbi:hypothetical protein F1188_05415 [Roseospira marina]|uniref:Glycosyl transferase family 28 C-terminal domain-containing protein n=1 Tax=Roseospira marina TaxID=140057 RepID=A0A5M6IGR5_9PROT|nr:glycosyltransferase [Roseospira marina]KAA5606768.1 hypothetical protein F1188_05415 [Roseospira marina]MBB4313810.1 putative glycosyltransferase [Roseospira marina]MBB5086972.1 putative glycosyltransferase [Roseospira marina]